MTIKDYVRKKVLGILGLSRVENMPEKEERITFVNDIEQLSRQKIREYNVWYQGDSDELLNFYTYHAAISYNYEPFFSRNKRNYFWSISSSEGDVKRTHSGQPKNIIDTLVSIIGTPDIRGGHGDLEENNNVNETIQNIIDENNFWEELYKQVQLPMTMVEGWGCWKVVWDTDISNSPIPVYYRAEDVDFIYKLNRIVGVMFKDYYTDGKRNYLILETRYLQHGNLYVETEIFEMGGAGDEANLKPLDMQEVDFMKDTEPKLEITSFNKLMAVPCIFYRDSSDVTPGRSMFSGKIDLFDDLDQCLSQAANTVRKSTPIEYFDSNYLERDRHGMPIQPKSYDRKYVMYKGARNADGVNANTQPVQATQPNMTFEQYDKEAMAILLQIMNGLISPATLGLDVAKKDNAEAQREKEKITVFTRKNISDSEQKILISLFNQLLCAKELMETGKITIDDYNISITFPEFADDSYENKLAVLGEQLGKGSLSIEMYLSRLYNGKLSDSEYKKELEYLKKFHGVQKESTEVPDQEPDQEQPDGTALEM